MIKTIENLKSGNYEVVDNQGVSVTIHFIECLEKELAELEEKLAESEKSKKINIKERDKICLEMATDYNRQILELKQQLAEKEKENKKLKSENHALMSDNAYQEEDIFELNSFKEYYKNNTIDFAVAELEKVISIIDASARYDHIIWDFDIKAHIGQQIEKLKEKK